MSGQKGIEKKLDHIIEIIGGIMEDQTVMKNELAAMRKDQEAMRKDQEAMRKENETRHQEIMERFTSIEADQDHIWNKAAQNEREFAKFKTQHGF
ncbi:hypothetical protein F3157_17740 [Virgibacillus dakarensis]|uniref:Uncharacterized protein n=1 Tax=Lentibacillus populi TaxID=1827502 RepID=A0A9W5TWG7_9BACI|nr:hypothetical protein [Lentibacillus populi]MBT2218107.1 hypothetical protein [Virgibacillus dakarensis]MTW87474.1 hypothetical protein [Virgibacillus dakarensis]GGB37410.1 hypothetical protein GCM10011409_13550 [Lentibacillus populi]